MNGRKLVLIGIVFVVIGLAFICYPISKISAEIEAEPVGLLGFGEPDAWVVTWSDGSMQFKLKYIGYGCVQEVKAECVSGIDVTPPKVGETCTLIGNQKWDCGKGKQELRWSETISQVCKLFVPKMGNCPPVCPECLP